MSFYHYLEGFRLFNTVIRLCIWAEIFQYFFIYIFFNDSTLLFDSSNNNCFLKKKKQHKRGSR